MKHVMNLYHSHCKFLYNYVTNYDVADGILKAEVIRSHERTKQVPKLHAGQ